MGLFRRLFGKRDTPASNVRFSRGPKAVDAEPGTEDATFLREAGVILGCEPDAVDFSKDLQADYGCDELEMVEFFQVAEDIWDISLLPNPFRVEDAERAIRKLRTLSDIVNAAKAKRGM